ncbi:MAG: thioredoxin domain-containing protein [Candidatus Omnitrophica bacterium]|nr:thioredoxin domain-containing protein [Candidatus Omnitrophota bacterium]
MSKKRIYIGLILLSAIGLAISLILSHLHYSLSLGRSLSFKLCQKGCDAVNTSSYSEFFGIPIASYGAVAYALLFLLAFVGLFLGGVSLDLFLFSLLCLLSLGCLFASLVLAGISFFRLSSFCNLCGLTYGINFLLAGLSWKGLGVPPQAIVQTVQAAFGKVLEKKDLQKNSEDYYKTMIMRLVLLLLAVGAFSGLGVSFFHSAKYQVFDKERLRKFLEHYATLGRFEVRTQGAPSKGSATPKLTLVDFSDFTCSHCRVAYFVFKRLLPEYRNELQIIYKHYPHDKTCNPYSPSPSAAKACQLAKAALCAQRYGKFWEYHDLLFESPKVAKPEELSSFAEKVGITQSDFSRCLEDSETDKILLLDIEEAHRLGVKSTPTFFFNGKPIEGLPPTPLLHTLLQREIRERSRH